MHPYEMMTRHVRSTVASKSELTIRHWAQVLTNTNKAQHPDAVKGRLGWD